MTGETKTQQRMPFQGDERPAGSYLVRFWLEPREGEEEPDLCRGYARDLRTGEERYFGDPRRLSEHILSRLQAKRAEESQSEPHLVEATIG